MYCAVLYEICLKHNKMNVPWEGNHKTNPHGGAPNAPPGSSEGISTPVARIKPERSIVTMPSTPPKGTYISTSTHLVSSQIRINGIAQGHSKHWRCPPISTRGSKWPLKPQKISPRHREDTPWQDRKKAVVWTPYTPRSCNSVTAGVHWRGPVKEVPKKDSGNLLVQHKQTGDKRR